MDEDIRGGSSCAETVPNWDRWIDSGSDLFLSLIESRELRSARSELSITNNILSARHVEYCAVTMLTFWQHHRKSDKDEIVRHDSILEYVRADQRMTSNVDISVSSQL